MITGIYFLVLLAASVEDARKHMVNRHWVLAVYVLGLIKLWLQKENRWVTVTLTCVCFILLYLFYVLVKIAAGRMGKNLSFGGADVRLIPAMMLVQGWDTALAGIFTGLLPAVLWYVCIRKQQEVPLVPWMAAGCFFVEIFYFFFEKSML